MEMEIKLTVVELCFKNVLCKIFSHWYSIF